MILSLATQVIVQVFVSVVVVGIVADTSGKLFFQFPICLPSSHVIVEQAVDAFILPQCVNGFLYIGGGVEYDVILPVKVGQDKDAMPCVSD